MRNEVKLVLAALGSMATIVSVAIWVSDDVPGVAAYRTHLESGRYLFFRNVRSAHYEVRQLDGMTVYLPEERADSGWFQIAVRWRDEQAYIMWETDSSGVHSVAPRPDGFGLWDSDTATLPTHWWVAYRTACTQRELPDVLRDYFELVDVQPEILPN